MKLAGEPHQWERRAETLNRTFMLVDRMIQWPDGRQVKFEMAIDITDRIRLEETLKLQQAQLVQAQKMEAIGTLAGGIAHDFNNLLAVVQGHAELALADTEADSERYSELQAICDAAKRGADLVKQILTFSRKVEGSPRPVSVNDLVRQAHKLLSRTLPKVIDIELHLAPDLSVVNADPGQVEQILLNLAVNAEHAMPEGGELVLETENVTLDEEYARLNPEVTPGRYVALTVSDTGHGMTPEVMERIFEPFFSTKKMGEGTGLGLAMVFGIMKSHGGHIKCYSDPGVGATFRCYFPATDQKEANHVAPSDVASVGGTETILLVDDEHLLRELGSTVLSRAGYTVLTACNGKQGAEIYGTEQDRIALVIVDLIMPEMGGEQCLAAILKMNPDAKVITTSGLAVDEPMQKMMGAGAKGILRKPFGVNQLLQTVRKTLDGS